MKIKSIETLACDAGWRNYHFVKLTTDAGIVGWSEFDEGSARRAWAPSFTGWCRA
jgi:L-alanine-DL-glutamate epimerase-like enolase superfamily enzyme